MSAVKRNPASSHSRRNRTSKRFGLWLATLICLALLALSIWPAAAATKVDSPRQQIARAWKQATDIGRYEFRTTVVQTLHPTLVLENVGRAARTEGYTLQGEMDQPADRMALQMQLPNQPRVDLKIEDGQAFGRLNASEKWTELDANADIFASGGDPLGYLAAAVNVHVVGDGTGQAASGDEFYPAAMLPAEMAHAITRYRFDMDGLEYAKYIRAQTEMHLRERGELPAGVTLQDAQAYVDMRGRGEIWVGEGGLPVRQILHLEFPPEKGARDWVEAEISTSYSNWDQRAAEQLAFDVQRPVASLVNWLSGKHASAKALRQGAANLAVLVFLVGFGGWMVSRRHAPVLRVALNLTLIVAILTVPLLRTQQVSAFYEAQNERAAKAQEAREQGEKETALEAELLGRDSNPYENPLGSDQLSVVSDQLSADSAPDSPLRVPTPYSPLRVPTLSSTCTITITATSDCDGDGLTDNVEIYELGTWIDDVDTDDDMISDWAEVTGFDVGGQTWYLDPRKVDSNGDGISDGMECILRTNVLTDTLDTSFDLFPCEDEDGDGTPDVYDFDNDGDGVPDDVDTNPNAYQEVANQQFGLTLSGAETGKSIFFDLQIRPKDDRHLWWTNNVLDWPDNDTKGQITRVSTATLTADGDMMLTPQLEITIPYSPTNPTRGLPKLSAVNTNDITATTPISTWVDIATLDKYGISVVPGANGALIVYVPLSVVQDNVGGGAVAWSARMLYQLDPAASGWGLAHQMRLLWTVTAVVDVCVPPTGTSDPVTYCEDTSNWTPTTTIIQTYPDDFIVTGFSVQENHGTQAMLVAQKPGAGGSSHYDSHVWHLADTLQEVFLQSKTVTDTVARRFTLSDIPTQYANWNIPAGALAITSTTNLADDTALLEALDGDAVPAFLRGVHTSPATPLTTTVLLLSEEVQRSRTMSETASVDLGGGVLTVTQVVSFSHNTFTVDLTGAVSSTYGTMRAQPYVHNGVGWAAGEIGPVFDRLETDLAPVFTEALLTGSLDVTPEDMTRARAGAVRLAQLTYLSLFSTLSGHLATGGTPLGGQPVVAADHARPTEPVAAMVGRMAAKVQAYYGRLNLEGVDILTVNSAVKQGTADAWASLANSRGAVLGAFGDLVQGNSASSAALALLELDSLPDTVTNENLLDMSAFVRARTSMLTVLRGGHIKFSGPAAQPVLQSTRLAVFYVKFRMKIKGIAGNMAKYRGRISALKIRPEGHTRLSHWMKVFRGTGGARAPLIKGAIKAGKIGVGLQFALSGLAIASAVAGGADTDSPAFSRLVAEQIAAIIIEVIKRVLQVVFVTATLGVGLLVLFLIELLDVIMMATCAALGLDDADSGVDAGDPDAWGKWFCGGISGALAQALAYVINDTTPLVDFDLQDRIQVGFNTPYISSRTGTEGVAVGNQATFSATITNTLYMASPDWMGYLWPTHWQDGHLDDARFIYKIQTSEDDIAVDIDTDSALYWTDVPGKADERSGIDEGARFQRVFYPSAIYTFTKSAINFSPVLYLAEGFATQMQECWFFGAAPICWLKEFDHTNPIPLENTFIFDVFPADLDGFHRLYQTAVTAKGQTSYRLAWDGKFPTLADADGDGLRSKALNGLDPNDSTPDSDGDGLTDYYEVAHRSAGFDPLKVDGDCDGLTDYWEAFYGTRPNLADSDNDGLLDSQEVFHPNRANPYKNSAWSNANPTTCDVNLGQTAAYEGGWDIVYDFDGATPLAFRVTSDPLDPDSDDDGLSDKQEQVYGYHPGVASRLKVLGLDSRIETSSGNYPYVSPAGTITYTAHITNELSANYARGLLQAELPLDTVRHTLPTGVIPPQGSITMTGAISAGEAGLHTSQNVQVGIRAGAVIVQDTGRVLWLHMNEPVSSTTFLDSSFHTHDATCTGSQCPGADGKALTFDGTDDQLTVADHPDLDLSQFTVALYVKPTALKPGYQPLVIKAADDGSSRNYGLFIAPNSMQVHYSLQQDNCSTYVSAASTGSLVQNEWNHVAMTFNGAQTEVYINGVSQGSSAYTGVPCQNAHPVQMGRVNSAFAPFAGSIDQVEIYPQALPDATIQQRYGTPTLRVNLQDNNTWGGVGVSCPTARCPTVDVDGTHFDQKQHLQVNAVDLSGDAFTFAAWIRPLTRTNPFALATSTYYSVTAPDKWNDADYQGVFGYKDPSDDKKLYPSLFVGSNGRLRFVMGDGTNTCAVSSIATGLITNDNWQHVAVTHDGTSTKFYVDGVEITGGTSGSCASVTPPGVPKFYIGRPNESGYVWFEKATFSKVFDKSKPRDELELRLNWWGEWSYGNIYKKTSSDFVSQGATINKFRTVDTDGAKYFRLYESDACGWPYSCTDGGYEGHHDDNLLHVTGITNISHLSNASNSFVGYDGRELTDTRGTLYWDLSNDFFQGAVDDLQVYQYTLGAEAVADLYQATATSLELDLDEPPGSTVFADTSGNYVSVTCSGDTCPTSGIAGRNNQALDFDGENDFLTLSATGSDLGFNAGSLTVMMWIRPHDFRYHDGQATLLGLGGGRIVGWWGYGRLAMGSGSAWPDSIYSQYRWIHLAYVYEKYPGTNTGLYRFYVDGVQVGRILESEYPPYGGPPGAGNDITIGHFNGLLDDLTIVQQALTQAQIQHAMNQAPVVNLHLDEDFTSGTFVDTTENRNHATCTPSTGSGQGGCPKPGDKGQIRESAVFSDSLLTVANSAAMTFPKFTVGLWVKPTDVIADYQPLITKQADNGDDRNFGLFIKSNSMQVHYSIQRSNCSTWVSADSSGSLFEDQWNHVMMTYDGTQTALYINGYLQGTQSYAGTPCLAANPIKIGGENSAFVPFSGGLDEVVVYANALGTDEIRDLYTYQAAWFDVINHHDLTIDAEAPTVDLSDIPAIVSAHETSMYIGAEDATSGVVMIAYRVDGGDWTTSTITKAQNTGTDIRVFNFPASTPGTHTVAARATDLVGHVSEVVTATVIVDGAAPTLVITDQTAVQQATTELAVSGTVSDSVSGVDPNSLYITLLDHTGAAVSGSQPGTIAADGTWQVEQAFLTPPYGVYTVTAVAADQAQAIANVITTSSVVRLDGLGPYADVLTDTVLINPVVPPTFAGIASDIPYPADSRRLHLHFEAGPGAFVDASKNQFTLTCSTCPTTGVTGVNGDAVSLDGSAYLDIQNNVLITTTVAEQLGLNNSSFTVLGWARAGDWSGENAILGTSPVTSSEGLYIGIQNGSPILGHGGDDSVMTGTIPTNEWVHLAWRYDQATGERAFFVNGSQTVTATVSHAVYSATETIQIGRARGGNGYSGLLDELVVYGHALPDETIYDIANPLDVGIANMQARFRRFAGTVGGAQVVSQYGGTWLPVTVTTNSSNYTTWQVAMPGDLVLGAYKLDLLVTDQVSNSTFVQGAWNGALISPNLAITKTTPLTQTAAGENITYTLTYSNVGAVPASGVVITETIPADTRLNAAASAVGWSCTPAAGTPGAACTYAVGYLVPGPGGVISFTLTVTDTLTPGTVDVANTAEIDSDHGHINTTWSGYIGNCISGSPDYSCRWVVIPHYFDSDESDNTASATASMYGAPDLQVSKSDGGATGMVMGDAFTYTITYSNTGSQAAVVRLIETIPPYVQSTYEAYLAGWVCPDTHRGECTYDVGYVGITETGVVTFVVAMWTQKPPDTMPHLTNTVTISDTAGGGDLNYLDNTATITTPWTFNFGATVDHNVVTVKEGDIITNTGMILYPTVTEWPTFWLFVSTGVISFATDYPYHYNWSWVYTSTDGLDETQVISITATDDALNYVTTTFQLTVENVTPTVVITGANSATSGSSYSVTLGSVVDPGTDTVTACQLHWGDGASANCFGVLGGAGSLTHVYTTPLVTRVLTVALTDEDGTHTAASQSVYVEAASATITVITTTVAVDEGTGLPEGYWSFENPGLPAADDSGNGHHGTLVNGASLTTTIPSTLTAASTYALDLDGVDDYAQIPDHDAIDFASDQDFSIALWVKANNTQFPTGGNSDSDIVEKWSGPGSVGYPYVIRYVNQNGGAGEGQITVARYDGVTGNNPVVTSSSKINDNQYHHIAFVRSGGANGMLYLYIDGVLEATTSDTTTGDTTNSSDLYLGRRGTGDNPFHGLLDDLRIYGFALSATEIRHVMRGGLPNVFMNGQYGPTNGSVSLAASEGSVLAHGDGTWTWAYDSSLGAEITRTVVITATDGAITTTAVFTLTVTGDGVDGPVEDGAPNGGDGNGDGVPDRRQLNVTSIPLGGAGYATLAVDDALALRDVVHSTTPPAPLPAGTVSPLGFLNYQVAGVSPNQGITVAMWLPDSGTINSYFQYGPTPEDATPHWYEFKYDSTTQTGAVLLADRIVLYFVDGQRGDHDLTVNGVIEDPGAIVYQPPDHELTTEVNGLGSISPASSSYLSGTVVPVTATAGTGWTFTGWSGDLSGSDPTQNVTMNSDQHIIANFTLDRYTLATNVVGLGGLAIDPVQDEYLYGEVVSMTVTPATGWVFAGWSGDLSSTNATESLMMTGNTAITATFTAIPYTINVNVIGGNGGVSLDPDQASYIYGDVVMLTANPDPGYELSTWGGDLSGAEDNAAVLVDGNKTVTAGFVPGVYTVTLETAGNGQVSIMPQQSSYAYGDVITLTAAAALGWSFDAWVTGPLSNTVVQTMTMDSDVNILARFSEDVYRLNVSWEGAGDVSLTPDKGTYTYGEIVTATAAPATYYAFAHWSGAVPSTTITTTVVVTMTEERDLVAYFDQIPYTLTLNIVGSGGITIAVNISSETPITPAVTHVYTQIVFAMGQSISLTAAPDGGWTFDGWLGEVVSTANVISLTMDADKVLTATFSSDALQVLTVTRGGTGSGSVSSDPAGIVCPGDCTETLSYGTVITLTAMADSGSIFAGWSGAGCVGVGDCVVTMDAAKQVVATFTLVPAGSHALSVLKAGEGSGTASSTPAGIDCGADCTEIWTEGTVVTLTVTADSGSTFGGWSGACTNATGDCVVTMDTAKAVTATFGLDDFYIYLPVVLREY